MVIRQLMISVDAIQNKTSLDYLPLDWVGMGTISSSVRMENAELMLPVKINAFVNLISDARGDSLRSPQDGF